MKQRSGKDAARFEDIILDSISDGVFTVDSEWRITSFNRAAEHITGVAREEAIGQRCCEVFRASICEGQCALRSTLETGKPVINKAVYIVHADGETIPISISTAILKDQQDRMIGGVETFRDLSVVEKLRKEIEHRHTFADIISRNKKMVQIFDVLPTIAESDSTVLIEGDSGTGKELVARAIHNLSPRKDEPLVTVNCGALPDTLLESELFGYRAGAFTDAKKDKPGRFALAEGGTIFLDEIGDVSPALQARLLRVIQEKEYEPLGGTDFVKTNVRILAATNKNLEELVESGAFRTDLYYRINVVRITLPPLAERKEDIPLLVDHFIGRFNALRGKNITGVSPQVIAALMNHDFPGNVRELENIIEHGFVLCRGSLIEVEHLPEHMRPKSSPSRAPHAVGDTLRHFEVVHITDAVRRHGGNRAAAARELGIDPSTLYRKAKSLGIELPKEDGRSRKPC
jgi:PAS domain S-box-containing protein